MKQHEKIDYLGFPSSNLEVTKIFFKKLFNWKFKDYGSDYIDFSNHGQGINGGFYKSSHKADTNNGSVLVVFYSQKLEETLAKVLNSGGKVSKDIFHFPGGRRFQFLDPTGNEYGVWSDIPNKKNS